MFLRLFVNVPAAICRKRHYLRKKNFFPFSKKKMSILALRNYWCWKRWLLKRLKGLPLEDLKSARHHYYQFEVVWVGKAHLQSDMKSSCRWQVFRQQYAEFTATISNAIISKTKARFFILFLKCAWNLELFEKKAEYPSLIIPEIIDAERRGYLNV